MFDVIFSKILLTTELQIILHVVSVPSMEDPDINNNGWLFSEMHYIDLKEHVLSSKFQSVAG